MVIPSSELPSLGQIELIADPHTEYAKIHNIAENSHSVDALIFLMLNRKDDRPLANTATESLLKRPGFSSMMIHALEAHMDLADPYIQKALIANDKTPLPVIENLAASDLVSEESLLVLKDHEIENVRMLARKNIAEVTTSELIRRKLLGRLHSPFEYKLILDNDKIPLRAVLEIAKMRETPAPILEELLKHENIKIRNAAFHTFSDVRSEDARSKLNMDTLIKSVIEDLPEAGDSAPAITSTLNH